MIWERISFEESSINGAFSKLLKIFFLKNPHFQKNHPNIQKGFDFTHFQKKIFKSIPSISSSFRVLANNGRIKPFVFSILGSKECKKGFMGSLTPQKEANSYIWNCQSRSRGSWSLLFGMSSTPPRVANSSARSSQAGKNLAWASCNMDCPRLKPLASPHHRVFLGMTTQ